MQDIFVGREREIQRYRDFLANSSPFVLIFTGIGQSGKSKLLRHLKEQQTPRNVPVAKLDFAINSFQSDYLSIAREIARQIEPACDAGAAAAFRKAVDDGRNTIKVLSAQAKQDIINQEINVNSGTASGNQIKLKLDQNIQEIKRQVLEGVLDLFYAQLAKLSAGRLVLMLDTCEWLNLAEVGSWVLDELIPEVCTRMQEQGKQLSVIMASRVPPQLNAIDKSDQQMLRLPLFSKLEVSQYLQNIGVNDPTILDYVYDLTCGHAGSMLILYRLCADQEKMPSSVEELRALEDQYVESVRTDIIEDDLLNERFIQSPYLELTHYGVLLRRFNQPFLQTVFPEWLRDPTAREQFDQFTRLPHIMPPRDNYYTFFDLLREILVGRIFGQEKVMWSKYHGLALNYLTKTAPQTSEWWYHELSSRLVNKDNFMLDRQELARIKAALQEAQARSQPTRADLALLDAASDKILKRILQQAEHDEAELINN